MYSFVLGGNHAGRQGNDIAAGAGTVETGWTGWSKRSAAADPSLQPLVIAGTPCIIPHRVREAMVEVSRVFHVARKGPPMALELYLFGCGR